MLVGQRRVGADGIVEVTQLSLCGEIVRIDIRSKNPIEKRPRLVILAYLAEFLGKSHTGPGKVIRVTGAAVGKGGCIGKDAQRRAELVHRLLVIGLGECLAAFDEKAIRFGNRFLPADDLTLGKAAHAGISAFAGS